MILISESAELAAFCERQVGAEYIAVDTEFMRDTTYWPKLCLAQLASESEAVAVDCLAPDLDLAPLLALMADFSVLKVFHSARQDLEIFYHLTGSVPESIFDTQVAAMVCGFGESVAYETLARKLAGARIDKSSRFSDWARRPLPQRQLRYALSDVTHLRKIFKELRRRLEQSGRAEWLSEEMAVLTDPQTYNLDPSGAWRRLKTRSTDSRYLGVLRELADWRETEAQRRDVPRNRVLRDEQLFDIAGRAPQSEDELAHTRGLNKDFARGRLGRAILAAVKNGLALPEAELPTAPPKRLAPNAAGPVVDLLKVLLKMRCEENDVAQKLVANAADLEMIATDDEAPVRALQGWRYEIFGSDALALKHGKLAIGVKRNKTRVIAVS